MGAGPAGLGGAGRQAGGGRQVRRLLRLRRAVHEAAVAPDPGAVPRREGGGPRPHPRAGGRGRRGPDYPSAASPRRFGVADRGRPARPLARWTPCAGRGAPGSSSTSASTCGCGCGRRPRTRRYGCSRRTCATCCSPPRPAPGATMGLDPGFRTGVKVAVVDATGKVVATDTIYPHVPREQVGRRRSPRWPGSPRRTRVDLVAIGNGTASRETDKLAADLHRAAPGAEADQGRWSPRPARRSTPRPRTPRQELPGMDVSLRGAVSIARRLQDPLAELVKIDPKSIGVGQYQHDLAEMKLSRSLDAVVEDCVNAVGVDVNTASAPLLTRVSGHRRRRWPRTSWRTATRNGPFRTRRALKEVPRLGPKAFEQCAGFLRIRDGDDPLDASSVHPEAYPVVRRIVAATGRRPAVADRQRRRAARAAAGRLRRRHVRPADGHRHPRASWRSRAATRGRRSRRPRSPRAWRRSPTSSRAWCWRAWSPTWPRSARSSTSACTRTAWCTCRRCRTTFVKDPREVVKPGDVVRVKVLRRRRRAQADLADAAAGRRGGGPARRRRAPGASGPRREAAPAAPPRPPRPHRRRRPARWPRRCAGRG